MKASDISDAQILEIIRQCSDCECSYPMTAGYHGGRSGYGYDPDDQHGHRLSRWDLAWKLLAPEKVVQAKIRKLIRRGLTDGCGCGCRADLEITQAGRAYLAESGQIHRG